MIRDFSKAFATLISVILLMVSPPTLNALERRLVYQSGVFKKDADQIRADRRAGFRQVNRQRNRRWLCGGIPATCNHEEAAKETANAGNNSIQHVHAVLHNKSVARKLASKNCTTPSRFSFRIRLWEIIA